MERKDIEINGFKISIPKWGIMKVLENQNIVSELMAEPANAMLSVQELKPEMQIGVVVGDPPKGAPARVEFFDGEIVHGRVQEYRMENSGFFLYPTSPESNNELIFVVARAINTLSLEG